MQEGVWGVGANLSKLEKQALDLIKNNKGILQSMLWRQLGLDSRDGSRLVLRLVRKGLVRREQVSVNGRRTYKLYPVEAKIHNRRLIISMELSIRIPCTTCPLFRECGVSSKISPERCPHLDRWLARLAGGKT